MVQAEDCYLPKLELFWQERWSILEQIKHILMGNIIASVKMKFE